MSFIPINNNNKHPDAISQYTAGKMGDNISAVKQQSNKRRLTRCMSVISPVLGTIIQCRRCAVDLGLVKLKKKRRVMPSVQLVLGGELVGNIAGLTPGCHSVKAVIDAIAPTLKTVLFHKTQIDSMKKLSEAKNTSPVVSRLIHIIFSPKTPSGDILICRRCITTQANRVLVVPPVLELT